MYVASEALVLLGNFSNLIVSRRENEERDAVYVNMCI